MTRRQLARIRLISLEFLRRIITWSKFGQRNLMSSKLIAKLKWLPYIGEINVKT